MEKHREGSVRDLISGHEYAIETRLHSDETARGYKGGVDCKHCQGGTRPDLGDDMREQATHVSTKARPFARGGVR